tara:strand:+ start:360 stop:668 length:309 start_codon:yes stop_codon:yes gene_type:complete
MKLDIEFKGDGSAVIKASLPFSNKRISVEDSVVYHTPDILKEFNKTHPKKVVKTITGPHKISNCGSREESTGEWIVTFDTAAAAVEAVQKKKVAKKTTKKGA